MKFEFTVHVRVTEFSQPRYNTAVSQKMTLVGIRFKSFHTYFRPDIFFGRERQR